MDFIFITGMPRSGTTLLQNIIVTNNNIVSSPETHLFKLFSKTIGAERSLPPLLKLGLYRSIKTKDIKKYLIKLPFIKIEEINCLINRKKSIKIKTNDLLRIIYLTLKDNTGKIFVDKSPNHIFFIKEIKKVFPNTKFIFLLRDPRDAILSFLGMLEKQGKKKRSVIELSYLYKESIKHADRYNIYKVRYEDLVQKSELEQKKLSEYLDINLKSSDLKIMKDNANKIISPFETWKNNNFKEIFISSIGNFKTKMDKKDIKLIEIYNKKEMYNSGYKIEYSKNIYDYIRFAIVFCGFIIHRVFDFTFGIFIIVYRKAVKR